MDKYARLYLVNCASLYTGPPRLRVVSLKDSDAIADQRVGMDLTTKALGGF